MKNISITDALNKAVDVFVSHYEESFEDVLANGLAPIAYAAGLDCIDIYTTVDKINNKLGHAYQWKNKAATPPLLTEICEIRFEETNRKVGSTFLAHKKAGGMIPLNDELKILPDNAATLRWFPRILNDEVIDLRLSEMSEDEYAFLQPLGIKSIIMVPVFTHGELWGMAAFQDHTHERAFDISCVGLLRSAARLCANAIMRTETTRNADETFMVLIRRTELIDTLNNTAIMFLSHSEKDFEDIMTSGIQQIVDIIFLDRVTVWKNIKSADGLCTSQIYRWDRESGGTTPPTKGLTNLSYNQIVPHWEEILSSGESLNGPVKTLPGAKMLQSFGVVSAFIAPVFMEKTFWGFVLYEDRYNERHFDHDVIDMLRSAAFLCANCIMRHTAEEDIAKANEQLKEALLKANAASKAKSDFLSNMSHEIRTPLNAIIGMTYLGKNARDKERRIQAWGKIEEASTHLLYVINSILDMSKIEANKWDLSPVEYNFEAMIHRVASIMKNRIDEKEQYLNVEVDSKIPHFVVGDDQRLAQVIMNLLSNAVKFTKTGGKIGLNVTLLNQYEDGCELQIEVADTGIGIAPEHQEKIFQAFEQADNSTSREFGGTGLGLVISKGIIELMGGRIWVTSELGVGTKFIFTLHVASSEKKLTSLLYPGVEWENLRVLVMDESLYTREYFADFFNAVNIACDTAANIQEAFVAIVQKGKYDLCFFNWKVYDRGLEFAKELRFFERVSKLSCVILVTEKNWNDIRNMLFSLGINKYLQKPLYAKAIIDCINSCFHEDDTEEEDIYAQKNEFEGKRLLLVEDNMINREIILSLLENTGIVIECAQNGKEAVRMVNENHAAYDMIFMDMQMPVMDGLEATRSIRRLPIPGIMDLPIIALTANVFNENVQDCLAAGMDDHLGKPVSVYDLMTKLRKYMNAKGVTN